MYTFYAVFGNPVLHSKSPQLFGPVFRKEDKVCYTRIRPRSAEDLVHIFRLLNIQGASITSPFKEDVAPLVDMSSSAARAIGAVNCLRLDNGRLEGHNTDHHGVTGALQEAGLSLNGARVLVLGAGGAGRAAVYGLVHAGASVSISNRTLSKALELAGTFDCAVIPWNHTGPISPFDAVVSSLLPEAVPPFTSELKYDVMLDAVYKPSEMTAHSKAQGIPSIGGERWLIHQGVEAAAFYLGVKPSPGTLAGNLDATLKEDSLRIFILSEDSIDRFSRQPHDLVISSFGLDDSTVNQLIHEEKDMAFGR